MKDLGVIYDSKLSFTSHIDDLYTKCIKLVGFIFRTSSDFQNATTILTLFNSLIRSKLEYVSTIWNPSSQSSKYLIEKLQKKVVRFLYFKNLIPNAPAEFNYLNCLKILGIDSLEKRRIMSDLKVVAKTWTGRIDCETFIHNFNINVPMRRTRGSDTFRLHSFQNEVGRHSVFNRMMSNFDFYCVDADAFNDSFADLLKKFKKGLDEKYVPSFQYLANLVTYLLKLIGDTSDKRKFANIHIFNLNFFSFSRFS